LGHKLHESLGALFRDGALMESAFSSNHAVDEGRINLMTLSCPVDNVIKGCLIDGLRLRTDCQGRSWQYRFGLRRCGDLRLRRRGRRSSVLLEAKNLIRRNLDVPATGPA